MRPAPLLLGLGLACAGCAGARGLPADLPASRATNLRLLVEGEGAPRLDRPRDDLDRFVVGATGLGLVRSGPRGRPRPAVARSWKRSGPNGTIWTFRIDERARFSDGNPLSPEAVVRSWSSALRHGDAVVEALLAPVRGTDAIVSGAAPRWDGVRARGDAIEIRLGRPVADLLVRLAHPRLSIWSRAGDSVHGAGPFRLDGRALVAVGPGDGGGGVERVELLEPEAGSPELLARLGALDAAVVYGREAAGLRAADARPAGSEARLRVERLPAWDRTYALWLDPGRRWTRDPSFRRFMSRAIDRDAMIGYLFAGLGAPADALSQPRRSRREPPPAEEGPRWRVPRGIRPRLSLTFDAGDARASRIAARVKVDLERAGVTVSLDPRDGGAVEAGLRSGDLHVAVLLHRPSSADPVLARMETLAPLRAAAADAWTALERAALSSPGSRARRAAAAEAEEMLVRDGRLVPLVRVHAWLARDPALGPVGGRTARVLGLDPMGGGR